MDFDFRLVLCQWTCFCKAEEHWDAIRVHQPIRPFVGWTSNKTNEWTSEWTNELISIKRCKASGADWNSVPCALPSNSYAGKMRFVWAWIASIRMPLSVSRAFSIITSRKARFSFSIPRNVHFCEFACDCHCICVCARARAHFIWLCEWRLCVRFFILFHSQSTKPKIAMFECTIGALVETSAEQSTNKVNV